jgi:hypothetical protein
MTTLYEAFDVQLRAATSHPVDRPVPDCSRCLAFHRSRPEREVAKAEQIRVPIGDGSVVRLDWSINCTRCNDEVWSMRWSKAEHEAYTNVETTKLAKLYAAWRARRAAGRTFFGALPSRLTHGPAALSAPVRAPAGAPDRDWYDGESDR